jgi:hypothetical protein
VEEDVRRFGACVALGVGGATPVEFATFPMNQDYGKRRSDAVATMVTGVTHWYPTPVSAVFLHGL